MYDFDKLINRSGTYSLKWDVPDGELPMWVADMDLQTAPEIIAALRRRIDHGIYGYNIVPDEWYDSYISWWQKRHHVTLRRDSLMFCTGVIPAVSSIVRKLTTPNENVLMLTPVYNTFFNSIANNGCRAVQCDMIYDGNKYSIDFARLDKMLADPQTSLMILCNPHNPTGNIWDKETLEKIGTLCKKHDVIIISDEIHCDLCDPGLEYTPFVSLPEELSDISITCLAPTKTFNLAGIQTAAIYVLNKTLYHKVWRGINTDEVAEPNVLAVPAAIAAFNEGEKWLDELRSYIYENKRLVIRYLGENIPEMSVAESHATYLLWLDCTRLTQNTDKLADHIRKEGKLFLTAGSHYGKSGSGFLRMNIAAPRESVHEGLRRLGRAVNAAGEDVLC